VLAGAERADEYQDHSDFDHLDLRLHRSTPGDIDDGGLEGRTRERV
jgi:hypothetical protein